MPSKSKLLKADCHSRKDNSHTNQLAHERTLRFVPELRDRDEKNQGNKERSQTPANTLFEDSIDGPKMAEQGQENADQTDEAPEPFGGFRIERVKALLNQDP